MIANTTDSLFLGTWLSIGSPVIAELAALAGFDWVLLDLEHGCGTEAAIPDQSRALRGTPTRGIVRVGFPYPDLIARALDWGAHGIMVPHVESADQARHIVEATRYPPRGNRGYSRTVRATSYGLQDLSPEQDPLILPQIETIRGVHQAAQIAQVDGVNVLFVGPADLQFDLAHGATQDTSTNSFTDCLATVVQAATASGKEAGILIRDLGDLSLYQDLGFRWIAVDSDLAILRKAYLQALSKHPRCAAS